MCRRMGAAVRVLASIDNRDATIAKLNEQVAFLAAITRALSDRVSKLEGVEPGPDLSGTTTISQASYETGYSLSGVRKRIASGKIRATPLGGRWLIDRASLTPKSAKSVY
jgi:hypothetical protein